MAAANSNAEQFKLDNYLPMHRNLKLWYRTKKIKKAYLFLLNNEPIDLAHDYASLFYEDLLIAMTKMLKELSNHQ